MILESIWGPGYINEPHYLKVHAYRIRKKLHDEQGEFLQNDPSAGYRLAVDEADIGRLVFSSLLASLAATRSQHQSMVQ